MSTLPHSTDLTHQFQQAAERVSALPPDQAAPQMHTFYGLYKQATDGDHDTYRGEVGREEHDNPNGPRGLSQAQWDSWSQYKGMSQDEAMRRYVQEADKLGGGDSAGGVTPAGVHGKGDGPATQTAAPGNDPAPGGTEAAAIGAGLRGDLRAGTPYGSEEELKDDPDAQKGSAAPNGGITES